MAVVVILSGASWSVPASWNNASNMVETISAGGPGGVGVAATGGGGGGPGGYQSAINLTLSGSVPLQVGVGGGTTGTSGTGGTWFNGTSAVSCSCGVKGAAAGATTGAAATRPISGTGNGSFNAGGVPGAGGSSIGGGGGGGAGGPLGVGGSGGNGAATTGGAGGQGGGTSGGAAGAGATAGAAATAGGNGVDLAAGAAGSGGGGGGGSPANPNGGNGGLFGAGGGGSYNGGTAGAGAAGVIVVTWAALNAQAAQGSSTPAGSIVRGRTLAGAAAAAGSALRAIRALRGGVAGAAGVVTRAASKLAPALGAAAGSLKRLTGKLLAESYATRTIGLSAVDPNLVAMEGIAFDGARYVYATPHTTNAFAKVDSITNRVVGTLDFGSVIPTTTTPAFLGSFVGSDQALYLLPHNTGGVNYDFIVRIDLNNPTIGGVSSVDYTNGGANAVPAAMFGNGGATDGIYGYLFGGYPSGLHAIGAIVRFGLGGSFTVGSIAVLDMGAVGTGAFNEFGSAGWYDGAYIWVFTNDFGTRGVNRNNYLLRIDPANFTPSGVTVAALGTPSDKFASWFDDGTYIWTAPGRGSFNTPIYQIAKSTMSIVASWNDLPSIQFFSVSPGPGFYDGARWGYFPGISDAGVLVVDTHNPGSFEVISTHGFSGFSPGGVAANGFAYLCPDGGSVDGNLVAFRLKASSDSYGLASVATTCVRAAVLLRQALAAAAATLLKGRSFQGLGSAGGALARMAELPRQAASAASASMLRGAALQAAGATAAGLVRRVNAVRAALAASVASRIFGPFAQAAAAAASSLARSAGLARRASAAAAGRLWPGPVLQGLTAPASSAVRAIGAVRQAVAAGAGTLLRGRILQGAASAAGNVVRLAGALRQALASTLGVTIRRVAPQSYQGAGSGAATDVRLIGHNETSPIAPLPALARLTGHREVSATSPLAGLTRMALKSLAQASAGAAATLARSVAAIRQGAAAAVAGLAVLRFKVEMATTAPIASAVRSVSVVRQALAAVAAAPFVAALFRVTRRVSAIMRTYRPNWPPS